MYSSNLSSGKSRLGFHLKVDIWSWLLFGIGFLVFPNTALDIMTNITPDQVHLHMTRVFGLFCIYSSKTSYIALQKNDTKLAKFSLQNRLKMSVVLLGLMLFAQFRAKDWSSGHYYGMIGLGINIINAYTGINIRE